MSSETGFPEPNHTQTPNEFYDHVMKEIGSLSELKVTLAIIRQTRGWHKGSDRLSFSRIMQLTGLTRPSANEGIKRALVRGYVERIAEGNSFSYRLRSYVANGKEVEPEIVKNLNQSSKESKPLNSKESLPTKETDKRNLSKENKKEVGSRASRSPGTKKMSDDEFISYCKAEPAYAHINIDWEAGKMRKWCGERGKQPTRRRFINWLNNIELPMGANGNGSNGRHVQETSKANNGGTRAQSERDRRLDALRAQDERVTFTATPSVLD